MDFSDFFFGKSKSPSTEKVTCKEDFEKTKKVAAENRRNRRNSITFFA